METTAKNDRRALKGKCETRSTTLMLMMGAKK